MLFFQVRRKARQFSRNLQERLQVEPIKATATYTGWALGIDDVFIEITFRRFRVFDAIHVWHKGAEIWLPLLTRIRLRNTIRLLVTERALG